MTDTLTPNEVEHVTTNTVLSDLNLAKVLFQARTVALVLGLREEAVGVERVTPIAPGSDDEKAAEKSVSALNL